METNTNKRINTKVMLSELHRAFKLFNDKLFKGELPEPAILIQSRGNKKLTLGWCTMNPIWVNATTQEKKYEINIVAEALDRGLLPVMNTLLHEMVHLHCLSNNIKDTSRGLTYHNTNFKNMAETHGLVCTGEKPDDKIGWSSTKLHDYTVKLIYENNFDEGIFSLSRLDTTEIPKDKNKPKRSVRKYECPECGNSVRPSKDINLVCGDCSDFESGNIVHYIKVEDENGNPVEPTEVLTFVCPECGGIHEQDSNICPDCNVEMEEYSPSNTEEPKEPVELVPIVEVDTTLDDGAGNMIPVKQGMIDVDSVNKTDWLNTENIYKVFKEFAEEMRAVDYKVAPISSIKVKLSKKLKQQYVTYTCGNGKITFSQTFLITASDDEIIDTIKHQYIHHYQYTINGITPNHKEGFIEICKQFGLDTQIPYRNHRPMK